MESIQKLLHQVRRKQLLLCAYPPVEGDAEERITLAHAARALDLGGNECLQLLGRLHRKRLIERIPEDEGEALVLTAKGRRLVHRMAGGVDALTLLE